ncbi:MAG: OsmC family peroxiredoxin [Dehalococcoidia bacterium]|nr:OsmC family peroxiredoxin [Dehalococcoidia bacterium]
MTQATEQAHVVRNGVDVTALFETINVVKEDRGLAQFQFRATNRWVSGTHSQSRIYGFSGAGQELAHKEEVVLDGDHPEALVGQDEGPTPVEFVLHALASCLTAGIGNIASARGVALDFVESTVEGDLDMQGLLGLSDEVRNGYEQIRISFRIAGDAPSEKLREIVLQSQRRSAVFDILTNQVPVHIDIATA